MNNSELPLHTNHLLRSFGTATATGWSQMGKGTINHNKVAGFRLGRKDRLVQTKRTQVSLLDGGSLVFIGGKFCIHYQQGQILYRSLQG